MASRFFKDDNKIYKFVSYNDLPVIQDENNYYGVKYLCKTNHKYFEDWKDSDQTKELINYYINNPDLLPTNTIYNNEDKPELIRKIKYEDQQEEYFIHPKLMNSFCMWCDDNYAMHVSKIMMNLSNLIKMKNISLDEEIDQMKSNLNRIKEKCRRRIRLFDITDYNDNLYFKGTIPNSPESDDCFIQIDLKEEYDFDEGRLVLDIIVECSESEFQNIYDCFHYHFRLNNYEHVIKQIDKASLYHYLIHELKVIEVKVNEFQTYSKIWYFEKHPIERIVGLHKIEK